VLTSLLLHSGKISSISVTPNSNDGESTKSATVNFEKETAAKTALLLDNTQLGPTQVSVSSAASLDDLGASKDAEGDDIPAEDKPRSRILAEYLAHGYVVSDQAIQRAIDLDKQHGVSTRFTKALQDFDSRFQVSQKTQQADQKYGVSSRAQGAWNGMWSYFEKASETSTGQRIRSFYEQGNRQVMDVHNEAKHLAQRKRGLSNVPGTDKTVCNCGGNSGQCPCGEGQCACKSCPKNATGTEKTAIPGTDNTVCSCGGESGSCPCGEGKCACKSCAKNKSGIEPVEGTNRTKCNCGGSTENCPCAPGTCACKDCAKNQDGLYEEKGESKTKCGCGANAEKCPCPPGKCSCGSCPKAS